MPDPCVICLNANNNEVYEVKELQLGLNEVFNYQVCSACGSMQLLNIPEDFNRYYLNKHYYSFNLGVSSIRKPDLLRRLKASYLLFGKHQLAGRLLSIGYKAPEHYEWMKKTQTKWEDAILDVGCGNGSLLSKLFQMGFSNLKGIDPFIEESRDYGNLQVKKQDIFETTGRFDLIMMHHSLEHMFNPLKVLQKAYSLLNAGKFLLIRIPVMGNYGWKKFRTNWCGIDAPRHIFIPSEEGIKLLAKQAGFEIRDFTYDSSDYVIWSSEQYKRGIPLHAQNSRMINPDNDTFTEEEIKAFKATISFENLNGNGDTAAIYLYKQ